MPHLPCQVIRGSAARGLLWDRRGKAPRMATSLRAAFFLSFIKDEELSTVDSCSKRAVTVTELG